MLENLSKRVIIEDGPHTTVALAVLAQNIQNTNSIREKAITILQKSVDPIAGPPEQPSDGLLYGLIQSGKTSIIQITAALAADNGFQCILVLTSDIDLLYEQTLLRMQEALQGVKVLGKNDWKDARRFNMQLHTTPFVIVCSKNSSKLKNLLEAFKSAGAKGISALIIDDEADQASLNTYTQKNAAKREEEISAINAHITGLRDFFKTNTYLQVTATPQALFLQNPEHKYRPAFTILSEPGAGYVGGYDFFGDTEKKLLRIVPLEEVDELKGSHQPQATGSIPSGLRKALLTFLVSATVLKIKDLTRNFAFLCHVSLKTLDQDHIVMLIERYKEDVQGILKKENTNQYEKLITEFRDAYSDLESTQVGLPPFEEVIEKIKFYLGGANIRLINAQSSDEITLSSTYNIFIGGNKLGRGVTIKNLLVSYYGRNPKRPNADTVLQHARMYGYRQNDLGVTRLFLPERLAENFTLIHEMENALRELVDKYPEGKFEVLYISSPLSATRKNVLDPDSLVAYVAGESINPRYPLRTPEISSHTSWLDQRLQSIGDDDEFQTSNIDDVLEILSHCLPDPNVGVQLWDLKTIKTALDTIKGLIGTKAYLVIRRHRKAGVIRAERKGILSQVERKILHLKMHQLYFYQRI